VPYYPRQGKPFDYQNVTLCEDEDEQQRKQALTEYVTVIVLSVTRLAVDAICHETEQESIGFGNDISRSRFHITTLVYARPAWLSLQSRPQI
jgi:hypothetical protein